MNIFGSREKKKKSIALRALKAESKEESKFEDEDMIMIPRKFFKRSNEQRNFKNFKNQKEKKISNHIL